MDIKSTLFLLLVSLTLKAQKLPNKQTASLRALSNIKIDGRATEWGEQLQAYNSATNVFFTIANDDEKLYLTIQATDPGTINKIMGGGVTLTIITSGDKKDKNGVAITYPARDTKAPPYYLRSKGIQELSYANVKNRTKLDSFAKVLNKKFADSVKLIRVTGIKELPDNFISIYNDTGIKAAGLFDNKIHYTYELAVPLKYLGLAINKQVKFIYQIKLSGILAANATVDIVGKGGRFLLVKDAGKEIGIPNIPIYSASAFVTDFWGEYILAK